MTDAIDIDDLLETHPVILNVQTSTVSYQGRWIQVEKEHIGSKTTLPGLLEELFADAGPAAYTAHNDEIKNFINYCIDTGTILTPIGVENMGYDKKKWPTDKWVFEALESFRYGQQLDKDLQYLFGEDYDLFAFANYSPW